MHVPEQVADSLRILRSELGESATILLFGSRAVGRAGPHSDWDVSVDCGKPIPWNSFAVVKQRAQDAAWPYCLDVVDYCRAPESFRRTVRQNKVDIRSIETRK